MTAKYNDLTKDQIVEVLQDRYLNNKESMRDIAKDLGTYVNKLRRDAKKFDIPLRGQSEAQSLALATGRRAHPTKGKKHSQAVLEKISENIAASWTTRDRKQASEQGKKHWQNMTDDERANFRRQSARAIRKASKEGSKLEVYIFDRLLADGYRVEFHKEHIIVNERLQLDLLLPALNIAIEIDGLSHFEPIWGEKSLQRNQRADSEKSSLLLTKGLVFIRLKQDKAITQKYQRDLYGVLVNKVREIEQAFPPEGSRYFELGV